MIFYINKIQTLRIETKQLLDQQGEFVKQAQEEINKAGDQLKPEERTYLIDRLFSTDHPYYCPHGRPIIINLSIDELDQRFERNP